LSVRPNIGKDGEAGVARASERNENDLSHQSNGKPT
jgi:hypothetical protein